MTSVNVPSRPTRRTRRPSGLAAACATAALTAWSAPAIAQTDDEEAATDDVMVVLGSLRPRPASEIGSAISVIDADALDLRQITLVSDVLREVPGLAVNRTGPQGTLTQVRIRGAEGNQTLVYIDGVEANNPIFGEFNFANLLSADVEQVEVIRGPQSALYGSEAIGGVIAVSTKGPQDGLHGEAEVEGGSFGTYRVFGALGAGADQGGVRGALQYYATDGISASPTGVEDDGFENLTASLKGVFRPTPDWTVEGVARVVDSEADLDAQEFAFGTVQDSADTTESDDLFLKLDAVGSVLGGLLTPRAFLAYTKSEVTNLTDGAQTSASEGERLDYGLQATASFVMANAEHTITGAVEREELDFVNENPFIVGGVNAQTDEQTSLVGEHTLDIADQVFLSGAVRRDFNDVFEDATTYRVAVAYLLRETGTRFHASWGEGITDPSFNERFGFDPGSFLGNPNLKPERSEGWDIGVEQQLLDGRVVVDATYFNADLEDEITTSFDFETFLSTPINQEGESKRSGVEVTVSAALPGRLSFDGHYTYLDATGADGLVEVRRPAHVASANLTWLTLADRASLNLGVDYNGENEDLFFGFSDPTFTPRRTLDAYTLVRIAGAYKISDQVEIFARGENILDEDYEEVLGFASPGAAAYVGLRLRL